MALGPGSATLTSAALMPVRNHIGKNEKNGGKKQERLVSEKPGKETVLIKQTLLIM